MWSGEVLELWGPAASGKTQVTLYGDIESFGQS